MQHIILLKAVDFLTANSPRNLELAARSTDKPDVGFQPSPHGAARGSRTHRRIDVDHYATQRQPIRQALQVRVLHQDLHVQVEVQRALTRAHRCEALPGYQLPPTTSSLSPFLLSFSRSPYIIPLPFLTLFLSLPLHHPSP